MRTLAVAALVAATTFGASKVQADVIAATVISMEAEKACQDGSAVTPKVKAYVEGQVAPLIDSYFTAAAASDQKALAHLFGGRDPHWTDANGSELPKAIVDPYAHAVAGGALKPSRVSLFPAGDVATAQGVWEIEVPDTAAPGSTRKIEYGVDFVRTLGGMGSWKIWHISIFLSPKTAPPKKNYCHFYQTTPF